MPQIPDELPEENLPPLRHADTTGLNLPPRDAITARPAVRSDLPAFARWGQNVSRVLWTAGCLLLLVLAVTLWRIGDRAARDVETIRRGRQAHAEPAAHGAQPPVVPAQPPTTGGHARHAPESGYIFTYGGNRYIVGEDGLMEPFYPTNELAPNVKGDGASQDQSSLVPDRTSLDLLDVG